MMRLSDFIVKHSKSLLDNKQRAILYAVILSVMPFASWLSVSLIALVTLRKGAKAGFEVMMPALVVHSVPLMLMVPLDSVVINTLLSYVPCFIAAAVLRATRNWQSVFGSLFILVFLGASLIQLMTPDYVVAMFSHFKGAMSEFQDYQTLIDSGTDGISSTVLAQIFLGIQILSVLVSAIISLMFARSVQAKLFNPGGFKVELLSFRSGRLAFLMLMVLSIASYYEVYLAINILPLILSYFLLSGISLAYYMFGRKRETKILILLFLLILLKPTFVLFAYIVIGSLDSLFNFRLYLPERAREST